MALQLVSRAPESAAAVSPMKAPTANIAGSEVSVEMTAARSVFPGCLRSFRIALSTKHLSFP